MKIVATKIFFFLILFFCFIPYLNATEYKVNNITEFNTAVSKIIPGDTITMKNGDWQNVNLLFKGTGTSSKPILLMAENLGMVIISGISTLKIGGDYLIVDGLTFQNGYVNSGSVIEFRNSSNNYESKYCRLTNTSIIDYNHPNINTDTKWVSLYGYRNRVDHCYLKGKTNLGTTLVVWLGSNPNYHLIDHNYFGFRPELGQNGGETIRVGTSDWSMYNSYTIVEYNLFQECNGEIEIISSKSCENTYRYNTFLNCQGMLTLRHGNRCYVYNNFFIQNNATNSGGIRIIGEDHKIYNNYIQATAGTSMKSGITLVNGIINSVLSGYFQVKRAMIFNNTLIGNRMSIHVGAGASADQSLPPLDCKIFNNIIYSTTSPLVTFSDTPINLEWKGNIFWGASTGFTTLPAENRVIDPILLPEDNLNVRHIDSTSPAINYSYVSYSELFEDMDGQLRDSLKDIGADEYSITAIKHRPLRSTDVGPGSEPTSVKSEKKNTIINNFKLYQNYPNPFNPNTVISYEIPLNPPLLKGESGAGGFVVLKIYNILGSVVETLVNEPQTAGEYSVEWNGSKYSSGIYYYELSVANNRSVKKMQLIK